MAPRSERTTRSQIKHAIRQLSLRSRERAAAMKRAKYTCERCGRKQSRAKGREVYVEAHHREGIPNWEAVIDLILDMILVPPEKWMILCRECHKEEHQQ